MQHNDMTRPSASGNDETIKVLEKRLRQSRRAILHTLFSGAIVLLVLVVAEAFCVVPWWVYVLLLWFVPFGLIGDGINVAYITRKLRNIKLAAERANRPGR